MTSVEFLTLLISAAALVISLVALGMQWREKRPRLRVHASFGEQRRVIAQDPLYGTPVGYEQMPAIMVRLYNRGERAVYPELLELIWRDGVEQFRVSPELPNEIMPGHRHVGTVLVRDLNGAEDAVRLERRVRVVVTDTFGRRFRSRPFRLRRTG